MTVGSRRRTIAVHDLSYDLADAGVRGGHWLQRRRSIDSPPSTHVRITLYFGDRRSAGPYVVSVPAEDALDECLDACSELESFGRELERANGLTLEVLTEPRRPVSARAG